MKKINELRIRIAANWVKIMIAWWGAAFVTLLISMKLHASFGWCLIMPVMIGFLVSSPYLCYCDYRIKHYEKLLTKKKAKKEAARKAR